ncbi:MAG TPA: DUF2795 domain-containing protein, partial [Ktedonobacterales bacterium]|nr:DUF2795 domain-containing protein [Ktedonobacterales bacterium]
RDLRTPRDRQVRRGVVFLTPLALGAILLVVGIIVGAAASVSSVTQVIILLLVLWVLALGTEIIILARAASRRRRLAAMGAGPMLDQEAVAQLWVSGFSSYRIGRGRTEAVYWEEFTERVYITEELFLEEEGELDLVEVEETETISSYAAAGAGAGAGSAGLALHQGHRAQRHPARNRFRRRWGGTILLLLIAIVAVAFTAAVGTVAAATMVGIALAFLAPVIFLVVHRMRRDNEVRFATETAQKVSTVQYAAVAVQATEERISASAAPPAAPPSRRTTGSQPTPLHPARPVPVNPPIAEPVILPREEPEPPTLPSAEMAAAAGAAHENPDVADETIIIAGRAGAAHENPDIAEDTLLIGHQPVSEVSDKISITEFQHYLRGIHYPATREQLIAQARKNNAPPNMLARLEVLEESYTFISVSEVMRGYAYHRYLRGVRYPATRDQLIAHARSNNAPPRLIIWLESLEVTIVFASLVEVMRAHTKHLEAKGEESTEGAALLEAAPAATPPPAPVAEPPAAPAATRVTRSIRITQFQHYLHGVDYPATRADLLEQARKNNAPPNMIVRLEELDPNHQFVNARDVMIGYANHRFLGGVSYPATVEQLLENAHANKAKGKLVEWLEGQSSTHSFANLTEVVRAYAAHHVEEEDDEVEEP